MPRDLDDPLKSGTPASLVPVVERMRAAHDAMWGKGDFRKVVKTVSEPDIRRELEALRGAIDEYLAP